ncbi:MAG: flagellar basal body rod protein FlgB [Nitrospinae bacterium]|nr:flagellar basal body rod protein FlgB [Nitrospinota bacterium]
MGLINSVLFSDRTPALLKRSLDLNAQKASVHAANIANAETPGFKASRFEFESVLRGAVDGSAMPLKATHAGHFGAPMQDIKGIQGVTDVDLTRGRIDGNNVDMEKEVTAFSETQMAYDAAITAMNKRGSIIKSAITDVR